MAKAKRKFDGIELVDLTGDDTENDENDTARSQPKKIAKLNPKSTTASSSQQTSSQTSRTTKTTNNGNHENQQQPTPPTSSQISNSGNRTNNHAFSSTPWPNSQGTASQSERDSWLRPTQEQEMDMRREINLTQASQSDDEDSLENYLLYGILHTKIVGVRYYNGRATPGEYVIIRREPGNPYDGNAIRIDNVMGQQIGHIGRNFAAKLAGFMDSRSLIVEGRLTGEKGAFDCPVDLKLFGTSDPVASAALKHEMQEKKLPVTELAHTERERAKREKEMEKQRKAREKAAADLRKKGAGQVWEQEGPTKYSNFNNPSDNNNPNSNDAMDIGQLLDGTVTHNPRDIQSALNRFAIGEDDLAKMPKADQPDRIATSLLPYQLQGLKWLLDHESPKLPQNNSKDTVQLWKHAKGYYTNIATSFSVSQAPELASGGILADDMGLGKTLQIISLIMADPHKNKDPTLIVAPLSVMSNWSYQAAMHVKKKYAPRVLTYHGQSNRGLTPDQFREYDIVITTYQTMTMECFGPGKDTMQKTHKSGLFSIKWRRVVLDEGHNIRNPKAKMSRAACALDAQSRWVLTGTPIVNSLKDLYSHVKFLRLTGGLAEFEIFNGTLIRPLKNGEAAAQMLLQALMSAQCVRRMKDMKFVDLKLPGITFHKYTVKFTSQERTRYDAFKSEAKGLVAAAKAKKGDNTMTHLLEVLLRLRQSCNHWKMCGEDRVQKLLELVEGDQVLNLDKPENVKALQDLLQLRIDSQDDCPVCIDSLRQPVITACGHAYCRDCVERVIKTQGKCPMCRAELTDAEALITAAAGFGEGDEGQIEIDDSSSSSKIESLLEVLKASAKDPNTKTVVFSQWTSFLDLVQAQLNEHGLNYCRLDGRMNAGQRDAAIEALNADDKCQIMLASLSVCSVGLNLVAANQVILSDSWWAPAIEDQAVDRVHRLGQTRACKVVRLVMEESVEDDVLEIQEKKRQLAGIAFGEQNAGRKRKEQAGTLRDIERLLG